ncbi:tRNA (adenosine(37)-N6)-threonylcarbamoyltransferase complex ATPase subunit type 1 TsaE [Propionicimonas sp. T2.31MG-18]|uniref:tRNA (adenosine(37)-N6)-threonylcarbamoyltransferase complex ATPase subunit type 1 TsaE n=1 Tax=Propionicimonas sp. T2.31MG-18 TaxID=3157620 RepID=UPI00366DF741
MLAETLLGDGRTLSIVEPSADDAPALCDLIREAFGSRPVVQPPPPALSETPERVAEALAGGFGVLALVDGEPAGVVIVSVDGPMAGIHRVSVRPSFQRQGIASAMVEVAIEVLTARGVAAVELVAREEFPQVVAWWRRHGFVEVDRIGTSLTLARQLPVRRAAPTAEDTQAIGRRLAGVVRAGDVIIASGDLGAGKTTLTQGLGEGLGVSGAIISPTFVLSRVHPSTTGGPRLVHVDAYRLGSFAELEDLDLEVSLDDSVTLVEWGAGIAEGLGDGYLEVDIRRTLDPEDETRWIFFTPIGERWTAARAELEAL